LFIRERQSRDNAGVDRRHAQVKEVQIPGQPVAVINVIVEKAPEPPVKRQPDLIEIHRLLLNASISAGNRFRCNCTGDA
jgi:hypothetical protein